MEQCRVTWLRYTFGIPMNEGPTASHTDDVTLIRLIVEARREEYRGFSELWRHIEIRAQAIVALAGLFLAAFIAFITKTHATSRVERIVFVIGVALFIASLAAALLSLSMRELIRPPHFGDIELAIDDLLRLPAEERDSRLAGFWREEISTWSRVNDAVYRAISSKARFLSWSQALICLSLGWLATLVVIRLWE
jgi:hypothetical protein